GDNYDTDIMAGINCNIDSLLTLTGVTNKEQLKEKDKKPTYIVENLDEWKL
ncbi:MAG: HAD hydrolase-like protein, partial [Lactobacillus johnsonii]|nr:HAD hydrolase-like protein [Lactobacillus johnsonii]